MANDLNELKQYLPDYAARILHPGKGGFYVCPFCGSGTGKKGTAAFSILKKDRQYGSRLLRAGESWHCFACEQNGDIFDLAEQVEGCDKSEAASLLLRIYGTPSSGPRQHTPADSAHGQKNSTITGSNSGPEAEQSKKSPNFATELMEYAAALPGSPAESYLRGRGFTDETIKRFRLGYDPRCYNKQLGRTIASITIPYSITKDGKMPYYITRPISNRDSEKAYDKPKTDEAGNEPLFNPAALYAGDTCFIVESQLCAISIEQAGGSAVALGGTSGVNRFVERIKQHPTNTMFVLCLDNDERGQEAEKRLAKALDGIGVNYIPGCMIDLSNGITDPDSDGYRKDPNEMLQKDGPEAFNAAIHDAINIAEQVRQGLAEEAEQAAQQEAEQAAQEAQETAAAAEAERQVITGPTSVDLFLQAVQTDKYKPIPTGIETLDKALHGGLTAGQLIELLAAPGVGKTAMASWMFESMAAKGLPCLYLNLEMNREQMLARSIARTSALMGHAIGVNDVMQGYKWDAEQREAVEAAAEEYKRTIAPNMMYNPGEGKLGCNVDLIIECIEQEAARCEALGQPAPWVALDYLQYLTGKPKEDGTEVIKRAVAALKDYATRHNASVMAISATNRESNRTGKVNMQSGRDTSALEYAADVQLAMSYTQCINEGKAPDELTPDERNYRTLQILKGRFGGQGTRVEFFFNGETMTFEEASKAQYMEYRKRLPSTFGNGKQFKL